MKPKQILAFIVFLIVLLIIAVGVSKLSTDEAGVSDSMIENDFGYKVVYTTDTSSDPTPFQRHCQEKGGEFNSCGTICGPEAEVCAEICAFTCENIPGEKTTEDDIPENWEVWSAPESGFSMRFPLPMNVWQEGEGPVKFELWGPTQIEDSEFFDGISLTVRETEIPEGMTVEDFARSQMNREHMNPVSGSLRQVTLDERESWKFSALGELNIPTTYVYVPSSGTTTYEISYVALDPAGKEGFEDIVDMMLSTFEII